MDGPVDTLSYEQFPDLVVEKHHYRVGNSGYHEVRDRDRPSRDRDLHEWHVNQEQADQELKYKRHITPEVVDSMLCEREISSSADNMVFNLKQYSCNKVCGLSIK